MPLDRRSALALLASPLVAGARTPAPEPTEHAYGPDPLHRIDIYPAPNGGRAPVLLYVHGGSWMVGDKRQVADLPKTAARNGFLFASLNYRLVPQVTARGSAEDLAAAAAWLSKEAARFGGDPEGIFLIGHSSGAHLTALVGVDPAYLGPHGLAPERLGGAILVDGRAYDARDLPKEERRHAGTRDALALIFGSEVEALSPVLLVQPGRRYPPFLILWAGEPGARPQAERLAEALRRAGGQAEVLAAPRSRHISILVDLGVPTDWKTRRLAEFVRRHARPI